MTISQVYFYCSKKKQQQKNKKKTCFNFKSRASLVAQWVKVEKCYTKTQKDKNVTYLYIGRAHPSIKNISPIAPPKDKLIKAAE